MATETITIQKSEYNFLKKKADLFDHYVEAEHLSKEELRKIEKALKGPFISKAKFLRRHPELL